MNRRTGADLDVVADRRACVDVNVAPRTAVQLIVACGANALALCLPRRAEQHHQPDERRVNILDLDRRQFRACHATRHDSCRGTDFAQPRRPFGRVDQRDVSALRIGQHGDARNRRGGIANDRAAHESGNMSQRICHAFGILSYRPAGAPPPS